MTRDFNGTTDDINFTSNTSVDDMTLATNGASYFIWNVPDTVGEANFGRLLGHNAAVSKGFDFGITSTTKFECYSERPTSNGNWRQTNNDGVLDVWNSIGVLYDAASTLNDPTICHNGTIQTVGSGLTKVTTPSGSQGTDAADSKLLGNNSAHNVTWDGYMSYFTAWKGYTMSNIRLQAMSRGAHPFFISETKPNVFLPLWGNDSPEGDYSGNANHGTLTGTSHIFNNPPVEHLSNYISGYC